MTNKWVDKLQVWVQEQKHRRRKFWITAFVLFCVVLFAAIIIGGFFTYRYTAIIDKHLRTEKWALPSTVYADAPVLYPGMKVGPQWLIQYLKRLRYSNNSGSSPEPGTAQYAVHGSKIEFFRRRLLPNEEEPFPVRVAFSGSTIQKIYNLQTNEELTDLRLEPVAIADLFGTQMEKRMLVKLENVPPALVDAVIAIEDRRFFQHGGIDLFGIARALWRTTHGDKQGASTITQQLVKNFYLSPERSIRRKLSEAAMAVIMEKKVGKKQILEMYLNEVYLGQRGAMSINGVGAASELFFRKDIRHITVPEAALLAGLIQAPGAYNPYKNPEKAKDRRDTVLLAMTKMGSLTQEEYEKYRKIPIKVYPFDLRITLAPYFGDLVKEQLLKKYQQDQVFKENLHIFTTLDLDMQQAAEQALANGLQRIEKARGKRRKEVQASIIAIEPATGYVRAFVGGRSYTKSQFNRVISAARQPGSLFKPVVYAAAIESRAFTAATTISDEPSVFKIDGKTWSPRNYDNEFHGIVPMREALAHSMNVATANLAQAVGLRSVVNLARRMGLPNVRAYPSIALGTFEASPWQFAEGYTVFANQGVKTELQTVQKVSDIDGNVLERSKLEISQVLRPETAYVVTDMMKTVMESGTAASARRHGFTRPAAGKTGTTQDYRDAWFVGYTPNLLCLVWVGLDDNSVLGLNGAQAALPIWTDFMIKATRKLPEADFVPPRGVVQAQVDPYTGKLATPGCANVVNEIFVQGTEPTEYCSDYYHSYDYYQTTYPYDYYSEDQYSDTDEDKVYTNEDVEESVPDYDQPIYIPAPPKRDLQKRRDQILLEEQLREMQRREEEERQEEPILEEEEPIIEDDPPVEDDDPPSPP